MTHRDDDSRPPLGFERFRRRARRLVEDREALRVLGQQAFERIEARSGVMGSAVDDLRTLIRLLNAWVRADYRQVPTATLTLIVAAVLYFVVPTDLIPDFLFGVGFVDDIAVVGWVASRVRGELDAFRRWELERDASETMVGRVQVPDTDPDAPDPDTPDRGASG